MNFPTFQRILSGPITAKHRQEIFQPKKDNVIAETDLLITENTVHAAGGATIYECTWETSAPPRGAVLIIHGLAEYCRRYDHVAAYLNAGGYTVRSFDLRGHGNSSGKRGYIERFDDCVSDAKLIFDRQISTFPSIPQFVLGHSLGGAIATLFCYDYQSSLNGLLLSAAALKLSDDVSPGLQKMSGFIGSVLPKLPTVKLDVRAISHSPERVEEYAADPQIYHGRTLARTGAEIVRATRLIQQHMATLTIPLLILHGKEDRLTDPAGSRLLYDQASAKDKSLKLYDGLYHEILNEPEREVVLNDIREWLDKH